MTALHLSTRALLALFQWCDTLFPSGAFSHSFGLESAVQSRHVHNDATLIDWVQAKITHQVFPCDTVLIRQAYQAGQLEDLDLLQKIDASAYAMRLPRETREGGKMIASRLIQTASELYPNPWTQGCQTALKSGQLKGDAAVAFGLVGFGAGIPFEAAIFAYCYILISGQVSAALRLLPMGQQAGQHIIHRLLNWTDEHWAAHIKTTDPDRAPMSFMPAAEIGAMRHESLPVRLFQS